MGRLRDEVAKILPTGAVVGEYYRDPADSAKMIIEYQYDKALHRITPERINISTLITYSKGIYLKSGLTYNDLYEIISQRHRLYLIKDIDYIDNPNPVEKTGRVSLPINPYSLRFIPGIINVDIVSLDTALPGNEEERRLTDLTISPLSSDALTRELRQLSLSLFDCSAITCFDEGRVTIAFRQTVAERLNETLSDVKKEILGSFLIAAYSDIVSDVVVLNGPNQIPYLIRYQSALNDTP